MQLSVTHRYGGRSVHVVVRRRPPRADATPQRLSNTRPPPPLSISALAGRGNDDGGPSLRVRSVPCSTPSLSQSAADVGSRPGLKEHRARRKREPHAPAKARACVVEWLTARRFATAAGYETACHPKPYPSRAGTARIERRQRPPSPPAHRRRPSWGLWFLPEAGPCPLLHSGVNWLN